MKIAITGGTGFVGGHLARKLSNEGHQVVLIARGYDSRDKSIRELPGVTFSKISVEQDDQLRSAFHGCDAVAHCAGINREIGTQTYKNIHVEGTRSVVNAAKEAGIRKIALLSFLRARPDCGSGYHESKWAAEEIVRGSGLDYTILKPGVIYGRGDHMLDHLSHALHTFPVFAFVGMQPTPVRPIAVEDIIEILYGSLIKGQLSHKTVAVVGPEEMQLDEAVQRVASVLGKRPLTIRMPVWFHYFLGWICERVMTVPLVSLAQVRILSEGVVKPMGTYETLPEDLMPRTTFNPEQIRKGLPEPGTFGLKDLRCFGN